jgi:hypothetical protein
LIPSGVSSNAQARMRAIGKPTAISNTTRRTSIYSSRTAFTAIRPPKEMSIFDPVPSVVHVSDRRTRRSCMLHRPNEHKLEWKKTMRLVTLEPTGFEPVTPTH